MIDFLNGWGAGIATLLLGMFLGWKAKGRR